MIFFKKKNVEKITVDKVTKKEEYYLGRFFVSWLDKNGDRYQKTYKLEDVRRVDQYSSKRKIRFELDIK